MNTEKLVLANGTEFPVVVGGAYSSGDSLFLKVQTNDTLENVIEVFSDKENTKNMKVKNGDETILNFTGFTEIDPVTSLDAHFEVEPATLSEDGSEEQEAVYAKVASITLHRETVEEQVKAMNKMLSPAFMAASFVANTFTDTQALQVKELYPAWKDCVGGSLNVGDRVTYDGRLYKVRQAISVVLENQFPSVDTAALYEEIVEDHAGTKEDPIPYNNNMELVEGKFYSQDGVVYECVRGTGQAVYNPLSELVGNYVNVAA